MKKLELILVPYSYHEEVDGACPSCHSPYQFQTIGDTLMSNSENTLSEEALVLTPSRCSSCGQVYSIVESDHATSLDLPFSIDIEKVEYLNDGSQTVYV